MALRGPITVGLTLLRAAQDAAQELSEKLSVSLKRGGEAINESLGTLQSELDR